jgi:DNA-binding GntR family transcriptional regulator
MVRPLRAYLQLAEIFRERIAASKFDHGPLPPNRALQETYDIGEYVVTRAIRLLEATASCSPSPAGVLYVRQRKGHKLVPQKLIDSVRTP